ncbi:MAG: PEGA domain-containing protein [Verrucomicrobia bacterium]|nr:PEGA domain-containing protein [Verrucomicrobiota bacterium]MBT5621359.1 PEGA domain-containing protein [Verrucomicrobiota bacterium]MBT6102981.1 PEGA domain-containing protein [Verrucomicrobiota bacterium]
MVQESATNLLYVNSDPPGAQVTLSTGVKGITPCQFELPGKAKLMVVIEKEGYEQVEVVVQGIITPKKFLLSGLGNHLVGANQLGALVDDQTGAAYELKPNPIEVKLKPKKNVAR